MLLRRKIVHVTRPNAVVVNDSLYETNYKKIKSSFLCL